MAEFFSDFYQSQPNACERALIEAAARGEMFDGTECEDEAIVSSELVRALVTGQFNHKEFPDWQLHSEGLRIMDVELDGTLDLKKAKLRAPLVLVDCAFPEGLTFEALESDYEIEIAGGEFGKHSISFANAKIARLLLSEVSIEALFTPACVMTGMKCDYLHVIGSNIVGGMLIDDAEVRQKLLFAGSKIGRAQDGNRSDAWDWSVYADGAIVGRLEARISEFDGGVSFSRSAIAGHVRIGGCRFLSYNDEHCPAFAGSQMRVDGDLYLTTIAHDHRARKSKIEGSLDLRDSRIGGSLILRQLHAEAKALWSINLNNAIIGANLDMSEVQAYGVVDCKSLSIGKGADFSNAAMTSISSWKAGIDRARASGSQVTIKSENRRREQLVATALCLADATVADRLTMSENKLEGVINLGQARCRIYEDVATGWPVRSDTRNGERHYFELTGFQYEHLENPDGLIGNSHSDAQNDSRAQRVGQIDIANARIKWLKCQAPDRIKRQFNPDSWRRCSLVLADMGLDTAAQRVSIERRTLYRRSSGTPALQKMSGTILHWIADYGHNPWKTVIYSILLVAFFGAFYEFFQRFACLNVIAITCKTGAAFFPDSTIDGEISRNFSFNSFLYSLYNFIPLIELSPSVRWEVNSAAYLRMESGYTVPIGKVIEIVVVIERILGALFVAIAVTGFTGMLSKDHG